MNQIKYEDRCDEDVTKLLGMIWRRDNDEIGLVTVTNNLADIVTKRNVLKFISSIYDPIGLISPATLRAKLFLQELWRKNIE